MELEVQHENQTIILWLRSGCRTDLSLLYELGKRKMRKTRRFLSMLAAFCLILTASVPALAA